MSRFVKPLHITGPTDPPSGSSYGTVTANTAFPTSLANGSWVEVVNSTPEDWAMFAVSTALFSNNLGIIHVATGATSSEARIATIPLHMQRRSNQSSAIIEVPIPIPAGTRMSVQVDSSVAGSYHVSIIGYPAANYSTLTGLTRMDAGPFNLDGTTLESSASGWGIGTYLDPGATANTMTAWTELSVTGTNSTGNNQIQGSGLGENYKYIAPFAAYWDGALDDEHWLVDYAFGPDTSSLTTIFEGLQLTSSNDEAGINSGFRWIPWDRPAGDKIWVRCQQSDNTAGLREIAWGLVGLL